MSGAWIRPRRHKPSKRHPKGHTTWQVLYRRGGREASIEALGSFTRDKEAKLRRDLVAGWLALGLNPKVELAKLEAQAAPARSFAAEAEALIATRHDAGTESIRSKRNALAKIKELRPGLAAKPAIAWTVRDVQELITAMVEQRLAPATIDKYITDGPKLVLDNALGSAAANPARDRSIRLPRIVRQEVSPPTADHVLAILDRIPPRLVLPLVVLEQTGMRVGEVTTLPWGDVDVASSRFRLSRERTKTTKPRWVQVPSWLMEVIDGTVAAEDRTAERRVFPISASTLRQAMARACRTAGIPLYSPHDLRHRRASLWHGQGLTIAELKERGGWAKAEIALDVYSHVLLDGAEITPEQCARVLVKAK